MPLESAMLAPTPPTTIGIASGRKSRGRSSSRARELLILDEPANALDTEGEALLERELEELRAERTLVVASHAPEQLERFATGRLALA